MPNAQSPLAAWLRTPLGRSVRAIERPLVAEALSQVFGIQMLQIGTWGPPEELLNHGRTRRHALIDRRPGIGVGIVSQPGALGITTASIDVVVLPHTLETEDNPHELLREVDRVLVGEGHLLILGFNPGGLWGLRRALSGGRFPPDMRSFIAQHRLRDWLALLGFEVMTTTRYCYLPPVNNKTLLSRDTRFERLGRRFGRFCGAYLMLARKHVYAMTPLRVRWQQKRHVGSSIAEPTTRLSK